MAYLQPTWRHREAKLLTALAEFDAAGERPNFTELVESAGLDELTAQLGVEALLDGMFITGVDVSTHDGFDYLDLRLLPEGRRLVGQWPTDSASQLDQSVSIDLFISHASEDAAAAEALIDLIESSLRIPTDQIRCTSVDGYRLPGGARSLDQLRLEIFAAGGFVGIISPTSLSSSFVLFELGARWGARRHLLPLLVGGSRPKDLPMPIADLNALDGANTSQVQQLVHDIGKVLGVDPAPAHAWERKVTQAVKAFR